MKEIIKKAGKIVEENRKLRNAEGTDYNIFSLLDAERDEVGTHELMLFTILNFKIDYCVKNEFIQQLLVYFGVPKSFQKEEWKVEKEHYTSEGRIDLFLRTTGKHKKCIVIELKIDAEDQKRQLERYEEYVCTKNYEDYRIVYLTLDGREPSSQSMGNMKQNKLLRMSFEEHILPWLEECIHICQEYEIESSFIQQYRILLQKIVGEENMQENICELVTSSKDLKACMQIEQALPEIKGKLLYHFLNEIHKKLKRLGCMFIYEEYECAKEYFYSALQPSFGCEITKFEARNKTITLVAEVFIEDNLQFLVSYFDENGVEIWQQDFMKANKRMNQKIEDAIMEGLNVERQHNRYRCIYYSFITNENNQKYDFKHFDDVCADLMDEEVMEKESKRIARIVANNIKQIQKQLEE